MWKWMQNYLPQVLEFVCQIAEYFIIIFNIFRKGHHTLCQLLSQFAIIKQSFKTLGWFQHLNLYHHRVLRNTVFVILDSCKHLVVYTALSSWILQSAGQSHSGVKASSHKQIKLPSNPQSLAEQQVFQSSRGCCKQSVEPDEPQSLHTVYEILIISCTFY